MKTAHSVKLTVFVKEKEDFDNVKKAFLEMFPFSLEKEHILPDERTATGFNEKEIKIIEVILEKDRHIREFLRNLNQNLMDESKKMILMQAESRLDEDCNFFLRFAKDKWIDEKILWLTDQGNCFHIKINVAVFPKKKEKAIDIIRNIFKLEEQES